MDKDYRKKYEYWLQSDISEEEKSELGSMTGEEISDAFYKDVEFGTAGMRGKMGLGSNRINRYTVRMAAKGLSDMLLSDSNKDAEGITVAVAYDTRNNSEAFAEETACVLAAAGITVYLFDRVSPVPLLSFAVRHLACSGGVVITASHNTREYNGFKTYDETGCQMQPGQTERIAAYMRNTADPLSIERMDRSEALASGKLIYVGEDLAAAFADAIADCGIPCDGSLKEKDCEDLNVVYTPIHGSGRDYVLDSLRRAGFSSIRLVESQAEYDGDFPTVKKPNPEDSEALAMAAETAVNPEEEAADIIIGTDPDCDRIGLGVLVRNEDGERSVQYLTGNQTGALMIDYLCRYRSSGRLVTTIVTSELGSTIARSKGIEVDTVLTGFKYIGGVMNALEREGQVGSFLMGYEESYGYLPGMHARDKDGISAALVICRMAAWHKARGRTLADALKDLYAEFGFWRDSQESLVYEGAEGEKTMKKIMESLRGRGKEIFNCSEGEKDRQVEFLDYRNCISDLPAADVLKYRFSDGSWLAVRPSGTEPKIKIYYCIKGADENATIDRQQAVADCIHTACSTLA